MKKTKTKKAKKVSRSCSDAGSDLKVLRTSRAGKKLSKCKK